MSLWFDLRIGRNIIGRMEIRRTRHLDLTDKAAIADEVSVYEITIDDEPRGTVEHRYGDGAWTLLRKALEEAARQHRGITVIPPEDQSPEERAEIRRRFGPGDPRVRHIQATE